MYRLLNIYAHTQPHIRNFSRDCHCWLNSDWIIFLKECLVWICHTQILILEWVGGKEVLVPGGWYTSEFYKLDLGFPNLCPLDTTPPPPPQFFLTCVWVKKLILWVYQEDSVNLATLICEKSNMIIKSSQSEYHRSIITSIVFNFFRYSKSV